MTSGMKLALNWLIGENNYLALSKLKLRAIHISRWLLGLDPRIRVDTMPRIVIEKHGDWYLCPDFLNQHSVVYSVGIGRDLTFDCSLVNHLGVDIIAFDPTPDAIEWLRSQVLPKQIVIRELGVAAYDGTAVFVANSDPLNPSYSFVANGNNDKKHACQVCRLSTIMRDLGHLKIDLLKLDIEGAEYDVLSDILSSNILIGQLLVEFHHRKIPDGAQKTANAVMEMRKAGYKLVHVSPGGREFLFLSKDARLLE